MEKFKQSNKPTEEKIEEDKQGRRVPHASPDGTFHYQSNSENNEQFDTEYLAMVNEYFDEEIEKNNGDLEEERRAVDILERGRKDLQKLYNKDNLKNLKPEEFNLALFSLMNRMDYRFPTYQANNSRISFDEKKEKEIETLQAKEVFMKSCEKIFSEVNKDNPENLRLLCHNLKSSGVSSSEFDTVEMAVIGKKTAEKQDIEALKNIAHKIQGVLFLASDEYFNPEITEEGYSAESVKNYNNEKGLIIENIYKLVLIRDIVYEKLYGNKNISVEDAKKIDEARENMEKK